jgi:hypothetical protein
MDEECSPFPFSDSDDLGEPTLETLSGAFGDVFSALKNPGYPTNLPADPLHPEHKRIYYRLLTRFRYFREKRFNSRCNKRVDLTSIFVLLEFFKDTKPIRWTRLPNGEHDVAWRTLSSIVRERVVNFAANAYKVRLKPCYCPPWGPMCTNFVYPEYEAALKEAERESKAPWGYEFVVFMWMRRMVGNDLALLIIIDWL